ncbi:response regulator [Larkinella terrae]|uniref:Response regulator n=1 Tax=Larkinella terrae TaxID=2025311 RepID=A0A7K0EQC9_9BACT|nr:response regulator [Larkinella terrae]
MEEPVCEALCVFIVDDDEDDQFLLQQVFNEYCPECHVTVLSNGLELLARLSKTTILPTLVLLDLNMPLMGGFEALVRIRQEPRYNALPVVVLTTSNQQEDREKARQLKADGFFTKPSEMREYSELMLTWRRDFLVGTPDS